MLLKTSPKNVLYILFSTIFVLLFGNISSFINYRTTKNTKGFFKLLDFDLEHNIPTFYAVVTLFLCFILLLFIAYAHKKIGNKYYLWLGLSLCFLFLSFDEHIGVHERIAIYLRDTFFLTGILYYAWVIPYGIAFTIFSLIYHFNFLPLLPKKIRRLFLISGLIYVTGAIGLELLAGMYYNPSNEINDITFILYTFEELLEMIGIAIFIYSLLLYIKEELTISINTKKTA